MLVVERLCVSLLDKCVNAFECDVKMTAVAMGSPQPDIECRWCFSTVSQSVNRLGTNSYVFDLALKSAERSKSTFTLLPGLDFSPPRKSSFCTAVTLVTCNILYNITVSEAHPSVSTSA